MEHFNKEGPIENMVKVNIYYQEHKERTEIDVIRGLEVEHNFGNVNG